MGRAFRRHLGLIAVLLAALGLTACDTVRPISPNSTPPPPSAIVVSEPFRIDQLSKATFPSGEYRPYFEDNKGYYCQAPSKIVANALFTFMYDGGLYLKRGAAAPTQWYVIGEGGLVNMGPLSTNAPCEVKP